jgi:hypothetical protein
LLPLILFPLAAFAQVTFADKPTWMKKSAFAEYAFRSNGAAFFNNTNLFLDDDYDAIFRWECLELNETIMKLGVSYNLTRENDTYTFLGELYVNVFNGAVLLENGTSLGRTRLWSKSNPSQEEPIIMWNADSNTNSSEIVGLAKIGGYSLTPQGWQKVYTLDGTGRTYGFNNIISAVYDFDTGIMIDGYLDTEPTLLALQIESVFRNGRQKFEATNIDLGPAEIWPELLHQLPFYALVLITSILAVLIVIIYRQRRKRYARGYRKRHKFLSLVSCDTKVRFFLCVLM